MARGRKGHGLVIKGRAHKGGKKGRKGGRKGRGRKRSRK